MCIRDSIRIDVYAIDHTAATGRFDITIGNLADIKDVNTADYDMLFLPGGPHYQKLEADERVLSILKDFMDPVSYTHLCIPDSICILRTELLRLHKPPATFSYQHITFFNFHEKLSYSLYYYSGYEKNYQSF